MTTSSARRRSGTANPAKSCGGGSSPTIRSISASTLGGMRCATRPSMVKANFAMKAARRSRRPAPSASGWKNLATSSDLMNFSNDDFIRTTEERHRKSCQELWRRLVANDQIYLGKYAGWYAVRDEAFYGEGELRDEGGKKIAPSGAICEWVEEPSYFFRLSAWQKPLLEFYEKNPDFVAPQTRRNEVISFVKSGLDDLSISRTTFNWGIPVPDDPKHIMYVWFDALTNYITAAGFPDTASNSYRNFWPANLHMVGKDIVRFHAIYWPAFLLGAGLPPPQRVFAHGWWTNE